MHYRQLKIEFDLSEGPPGPPGIVIVEEITESTATLSWSPAADNHSPISSYNLQARSPFSLGWQTVKTGVMISLLPLSNLLSPPDDMKPPSFPIVPEVITGDMESAMAVDLNPWVEYEFRVVATNPIGTGDPSTPSRLIRTNEADQMNKVEIMRAKPVSEEFQNGEGFGYIVAFRPNGTRGWKEKMVTSSEASKFIYRDESVPPLTPFEVKVGVYNNKGDGPFSQIVVICSAEGAVLSTERLCYPNWWENHKCSVNAPHSLYIFILTNFALGIGDSFNLLVNTADVIACLCYS
ncbi:Contactin-5 [Tupaia chinensis]|uniref:Contactin-5 n=1 Tax=Tupaia chinensis TaxID=246437 RepID=L9KPT9_TUPCH|nr:Contactin-5 [Tupaia chinensis]